MTSMNNQAKAKPSRTLVWIKLRLKLIIILAILTVLIFTFTGIPYKDHDFTNFSLRVFVPLTYPLSSSAASSSVVDASKVDSKCLDLPIIRPSGLTFLDNKVISVTSPKTITPTFKIGTLLGTKVASHMESDTVHFKLIKEVIDRQGSKGGLTFDLGANQGFFTYYLAALGMNVHSFEIYEPNFIPLQHGTYFNPKEIADRVNLYALGMTDEVGRFSLSGKDYGGFLQGGDDGAILGVSFDCFAFHTKLDLSKVSFVKIDVEGYEIAALQGAQNSLFKKSNNIGAMLIEVGPARWKRSQVDFNTGVNVMKKLSITNFKNSYILIRRSGGHWESCPPQLVEGVLSDYKPREIDNVNMYKVELDELRPLLDKMKAKDYDCNFWFTN